MLSSSHSSLPTRTATPDEVFLFGIPIGGLGWFATLLMGGAAGFAAFFAGTFLGILGIMLTNAIGHTAIDYADAYRWVGFPLGILVLLFALSLLITLRVRRTLRSSH